MKINYNEVSKIYDKVRVGDPLIVERILQHTHITSDANILDIGCGTGNNSVLMADVTGANIYGIDGSEGMLKKASEKNKDLKLITGSAITLDPFSDNFFDAAFMVDVIHHIKEIDLMFESIHRILKDEGKIFIFTDGHNHIKNNRLVSKYFPETIEVELKRYQSIEMIIKAIEDAGFSSVYTEEITYPQQENPGEKLIKLAQTKGYSMFHLISQEEIIRGIKRLEEDLTSGDVSYLPKTQMVIGIK